MKYFFLQFALFLTVLVCIPPESLGQWIQTNGISHDTVNCFTVVDTNLLAGTNKGVYRSTNNGTAWSTVDFGFTNFSVYALASNGTILYAGHLTVENT